MVKLLKMHFVYKMLYILVLFVMYSETHNCEKGTVSCLMNYFVNVNKNSQMKDKEKLRQWLRR